MIYSDFTSDFTFINVYLFFNLLCVKTDVKTSQFALNMWIFTAQITNNIS